MNQLVGLCQGLGNAFCHECLRCTIERMRPTLVGFRARGALG
jgi:hypothetical protein